ncbi:NAD(P)H-dependent oxidoreductase subunit E, partial [bacterium]|nr:NAD(P)H-dependent oxidoreductase subunit E [bacterium]
MSTAIIDTKTTIDLAQVAEEYNDASRKAKRRVIVCAGTGCVANGGLKVLKAFVEQIKAAGLDVLTELRAESDATDVHLSKSGCQGFCQMGPLVTIEPEGLFYTKVKVDDVAEIVNTTLVGGEVVERLLYVEPLSGAHCATKTDIPFYAQQSRSVLKQCGMIDPEDICEYIHIGGYNAARIAYTEMTPQVVCEEILHSGLRGRGGGGFPTGRKWDLTRKQPTGKKYVICNGDEGDPGAFMDRSVMEGNPHSVLEGMMIAARAIGADEGYVYVRAEYPLAVKHIRKAIEDAYTLGILGKRLLGSEYSFDLNVMEGAGAFVCGEETALIASIEGKRGMPSPKPPFPVLSGLWGKPTVINNVE